MTRYHIASAGNCESVRQAINAGWRAGPASHATVLLTGERVPIAEYELRTGRAVGHFQLLTADRLIVAGADAALEMPEPASDGGLTWSHIADQLGKTIGGVPTPSAASLVQVTRARQHSLLPTGVRDVLDDRYVDGEYAKIGNEHANEAAARGVISAELQGARATAALSRKDARGSQAALDAALGIGRSR